MCACFMCMGRMGQVEKLINALNRLETPRCHLRRCVSGASLDTVLRDGQEKLRLRDGLKDGASYALLRRSVKTGLLE